MGHCATEAAGSDLNLQLARRVDSITQLSQGSMSDGSFWSTGHIHLQVPGSIALEKRVGVKCNVLTSSESATAQHIHLQMTRGIHQEVPIVPSTVDARVPGDGHAIVMKLRHALPRANHLFFSSTQASHRRWA
jgi:hypothetical protein